MVFMLQKTSPVNLRSTQMIEDITEELPVIPATPERAARVWVSRISGVVGVFFLALALVVWAGRQGHYRLVLAFLVVAMFAAIMHSYTFENGNY
jgi:hypothetical protein